MHASFEWFRDHIHAFCLNFKILKKYPGGPPGYFSKIWVFSEKWLDIFFWPKLFFCATSCYSFDRMRASQNKISTIFHILAKLPRSKQKVTCVRGGATLFPLIIMVFSGEKCSSPSVKIGRIKRHFCTNVRVLKTIWVFQVVKKHKQ